MRTYNRRKGILFTGGAGFLGSHLIGGPLERGDGLARAANFFKGTQRDTEAYLGGWTPQFGLQSGPVRTVASFNSPLSANF